MWWLHFGDGDKMIKYLSPNYVGTGNSRSGTTGRLRIVGAIPK